MMHKQKASNIDKPYMWAKHFYNVTFVLHNTIFGKN